MQARVIPATKLAVEFRAFLHRRRRHVLSLVAIEVGLTALLSVVLLVFWNRGPALWYVLGALHMLLICAVPAAIGLAFLANSRTAIWNLRGAMGESNTSEVLQSARKQKVIWGYVESVAITGGDIDHLVVTRRAGLLPPAPGISRSRLRPATPPCSDRTEAKVSHLHSNRQRLTAHVDPG